MPRRARSIVRRMARRVVPETVRRKRYKFMLKLRHRGDVVAMKHSAEFSFWRSQIEAEGGRYSNDHIRRAFVDAFRLGEGFYVGKRMLDIGCGPAGSLEWADNAVVRVGLDPLVDQYRQLGVGAQAMQYVAANGERIPFRDGAFDVVSSFNSLDHVDDL